MKGINIFSKNYVELNERLNVHVDWNVKIFSDTVKYLQKADMQIECSYDGLIHLTELMKSKRYI